MLIDTLNMFKEKFNMKITIHQVRILGTYEICKIMYKPDSFSESRKASKINKMNIYKQNQDDDKSWLKLDIMDILMSDDIKSGKSYNNKIRFKIMDINDLFK